MEPRKTSQGKRDFLSPGVHPGAGDKAMGTGIGLQTKRPFCSEDWRLSASLFLPPRSPLAQSRFSKHR